MKPFFLTGFLLLNFFSCFSQDKSIENLIEDNYVLQEETNYEQVYETLVQYSNAPLELNEASQSELESLGILDPFQIQNLIEYRVKTGGFLSLYELQAINGFDMATIRNLLPFVQLKSAAFQEPLIQRIIHNSTNFLILQSSLSNSLDSTINFTGNRNPVLVRYRNYKINDFSIGFTLKNDAGEPIQWNSKNNYYGFDFTSFHLSLYKKGILKALTIGDYKIQFGQGLVTGGGFSLGKGGETIVCTKQNNSGILANTSSSEFFKGIAFTIPVKNFECTTFLSYKTIDGTIDSTGTTFTRSTSGYHRTLAELGKRKNTIETTCGFNIHYTSPDRNFQIGITEISTWFNRFLMPTEKIYSHYQFTGNTNSVIGTNINYLFRNINLFGETAISKSGGTASVAGVIASLTKFIDAAVLFRNYNKNFHSFYSNAFSEGSTSSNERGWYTGIKLKPASKIEITSYFDQFVFPWLKYQTYGKSRGYEYLARLQYSFSKKTIVFIQVREESKEVNADDNLLPYYTLIESRKRNYQMGYKTQLSNLKIGSRVLFSTTNQNKIINKGYTIVQDIEYVHKKFLLAFRYALFETDDYDNRQYVYERNFIYNFSITPYYGNGIRCYLMLRYKLNKHIGIWLRYTQTSKEEQNNEKGITGMLQFQL